MSTSNKGLFISFEGVDGCGKSTQVKLLLDKLLSENDKVELVREPGGIKISEDIRKILLNPSNLSMNHQAEALLMIASRAQLTYEMIKPLLKKGMILPLKIWSQILLSLLILALKMFLKELG